MTTYFKTWSSDGVTNVQVDDTYENLELTGKGTASTSAAWSNTGYRYATVTVTGGTNPTIAVASTVGACLVGRGVSGSTFTFNILFNTTSDISFTYYVFDDPKTTNKVEYIGAWNAAGKLLFNGGQKYMKVAGASTAVGSQTLTSGRTYAVLLGYAGYQLTCISGSTTPGFWFEDITAVARMTSVSGVTVTTQDVTLYRITQDGTGTPPNSTGTYGTLVIFNMVLDVTYY